jgi:hypothetical protein
MYLKLFADTKSNTRDSAGKTKTVKLVEEPLW